MYVFVNTHIFFGMDTQLRMLLDSKRKRVTHVHVAWHCWGL